MFLIGERKGILMRKHFTGFIVGFIFACLLVVPTTALADNIQVHFNTANISVDGKTSVKQGENYQLSNGSTVPFSINYKGTTYIPIRKISELLGISINYDSASKTVQIVSNSNNTSPQEKPVEVNTTNSAVTYTTAYSVFNECSKNRNDNNQKVAHIVGYMNGKKLDTNIDYSYYRTISSKINSVQLWKTTVDNKGNITKVKTVSKSKSGKIKNSDGRDSVSLSSGNYNLDNNVVIYKWTDDDEFNLYSGDLKKNDSVILYDVEGNKKYDIAIFARGDNAIVEDNTSTTVDEEKDKDKDEEKDKDKDKEDNNKNTSKETTKPKVSSKGFVVISELTKVANDDDDKVQYIVGYKDGSKLEAFTNDDIVVKGWNEPKANSNGFSNVDVYEVGVSSNDIIVSADKVRADVGQGKAEKADERNSVVIGGNTYTLSSRVIFYKVTDDDEYSLYNGNLKQDDMVQLYETDSSNSGYDIVIFSRP